MATQTKSRNNGRGKTTPDLMGTLGTKRGPGRPKKPAPTASQIADSIDAEVQRLKGVADILRGKA